MPLLAPLAAAIIEGLLWLFKSRLGLFIVTAMIWLGLNWVTITVVMEPTFQLLRNYAAGVGSGGGVGSFAQHAVRWMGVLNFDKAITMIISAYITRQAVTAGRLFLWKAAAPTTG